MTRQARKISSTGVYHIIIRGIGKQILFEDESDRIYFLRALEQYKHEESILIYAYCLMENHVHLLIKVNAAGPDEFMKRIEVKYAFYYNHKYERIGTLFQDRYKSEPVEDERYLLTALRYVIQNPEKAEIAGTSKYRWSSYADYAKGSGLTDTEFILGFFSSRKKLLEFLTQNNNDEGLELREPRPGETRAKRIIREQLGSNSGTILQSFGKKERNEAIRKLKEQGLSIRQIERLTGINRGIILSA